MFLSTYQDDTNTYFRIGPSDLNAHIAWQGSLRLPAGSSIKCARTRLVAAGSLHAASVMDALWCKILQCVGLQC
jgi:hypothetical protein